MPPFLIAAKGLFGRFGPHLLLGGAVIGILLLVYCEGKNAGTDQADKARLEANVDALKGKAKADEKASVQRRDDDARLNAENAELKEVIEDAPDPAAARRAYYRCVRLQQRARESGDPAPACV